MSEINYEEITNHMKKSNFFSIFETMRTLKELNRFNNLDRISNLQENVLEHSSLVTFLSLIIAEQVESVINVKIDYRKLVIKAMTHDLPEAYTGDIRWKFKLKIKDAIPGFIEEEEKEIIKDLFSGSELTSGFVDLINSDNCIEDEIVHFCDYLELYLESLHLSSGPWGSRAEVIANRGLDLIINSKLNKDLNFV